MRRYSLILLLILLVLPPLFSSDVVLTESEWMAMQNFVEQSQTTLDNLENQSSQLKLQLEQSSLKLTEAEKSLEKLKTSLDESTKGMASLRIQTKVWKTIAVVLMGLSLGMVVVHLL